MFGGYQTQLMRQTLRPRPHFLWCRVARRRVPVAAIANASTISSTPPPLENRKRGWQEDPVLLLGAYTVVVGFSGLSIMLLGPLALNGLAQVRAMLPVGEAASWVELITFFITCFGFFWATAMLWTERAIRNRRMDKLEKDVDQISKDTHQISSNVQVLSSKVEELASEVKRSSAQTEILMKIITRDRHDDDN